MQILNKAKLSEEVFPAVRVWSILYNSTDLYYYRRQCTIATMDCNSAKFILIAKCCDLQSDSHLESIQQVLYLVVQGHRVAETIPEGFFSHLIVGSILCISNLRSIPLRMTILDKDGTYRTGVREHLRSVRHTHRTG